MPQAVTNKDAFYRRFLRGEFGNYSPMWSTLEEWEKSNYKGKIAIRTKGVGTRCDYLVPYEQVYDRVRSFERDGYKRSDMHFSAMVPDQDILVQGYASICPYNGLEFYCAFTPKPMRQALSEDGVTYTGLTAHQIIKWGMNASSWDWFQFLLDEYPDHVVEFTCLRYNWGVLPWDNTMFWEVRLY